MQEIEGLVGRIQKAELVKDAQSGIEVEGAVNVIFRFMPAAKHHTNQNGDVRIFIKNSYDFKREGTENLFLLICQLARFLTRQPPRKITTDIVKQILENIVFFRQGKKETVQISGCPEQSQTVLPSAEKESVGLVS